MLYRMANDGQAVTVALEGQLNFAANEEFSTLLGELSDVEKGRVIFDLSSLSHMDSVGLGLLYIAKEELDTHGTAMCLAKPRSAVLRLLELTEADKTFNIKP
ncbi:MAG: STAS domain-containing protein [Magnetospirillum sp.]|nr:STAS domain-containing protein [Magnetospirillum sp.]